MFRSRTQGRKLNWKVIPGVISFQVTAAAINLDEITYEKRWHEKSRRPGMQHRET